MARPSIRCARIVTPCGCRAGLSLRPRRGDKPDAQLLVCLVPRDRAAVLDGGGATLPFKRPRCLLQQGTHRERIRSPWGFRLLMGNGEWKVAQWSLAKISCTMSNLTTTRAIVTTSCVRTLRICACTARPNAQQLERQSWPFRFSVLPLLGPFFIWWGLRRLPRFLARHLFLAQLALFSRGYSTSQSALAFFRNVLVRTRGLRDTRRHFPLAFFPVRYSSLRGWLFDLIRRIVFVLRTIVDIVHAALCGPSDRAPAASAVRLAVSFGSVDLAPFLDPQLRRLLLLVVRLAALVVGCPMFLWPMFLHSASDGASAVWREFQVNGRFTAGLSATRAWSFFASAGATEEVESEMLDWQISEQ